MPSETPGAILFAKPITSKTPHGLVSQITANNYIFDIVMEFIYLDFAVTIINDVSMEILIGTTMASIGN